MTMPFKKLKTGNVEVDVEAPSHGVPQEVEVEAPSQDHNNSPPHSSKVGYQEEANRQKKRLDFVPTFSIYHSIKEGVLSEHKLCIKYASDKDYASDCDTHVHLYAVVDWELLPTGLGSINAIYRLDNSRKYFTSLREILHLVTRADLMTIYGRVMTFYRIRKLRKLVLFYDFDGFT
ncbi:hypothetical protein Tco_0177881 [Tanacetum coccineum]